MFNQNYFWHSLLNGLTLFLFLLVFSSLNHKNTFHVWIKFFSHFGQIFMALIDKSLLKKMGKFGDFILMKCGESVIWS